ncbi:MAG: anti-sigma factor [Chloroflexota bacterium]
MLNQNHIHNQTSDYVLGLLSSTQRQQVESHAHHCPDCQEALQAEKQLAQTIRSTLHVATQPAPRRLRQLMPAIPQQKTAVPWLQRYQKQLAPVALLLFLLLGSLGWNATQQTDWRNPQPAFLALTATSTQAPTATATDLPEAIEPTSTAVAEAPSDQPVTPAPNPTPIAALIQVSN